MRHILSKARLWPRGAPGGVNVVGVRGDRLDRVNRGRLGPKGLHGWEANHSADRLTGPLIRRGGRLESASWDEARSGLRHVGIATEKSFGRSRGDGGRWRSSGAAATIRANCFQRWRPRLGVRSRSG
jgi:hypothetical protein